MSIRLMDGNRVCIVGGGPAGSFAALHLLRAARQAGIHLEVLIFEPRDFSRPGPSGCNRCAGVLSSNLVRGLKQIGISLPESVIQAHLRTYALHLDGEVFRIEQPDPTRHILSVYRGGGPRLRLHGDRPESFDGFLLKQATDAGAQHIPARVRWAEPRDGFPLVITARERFPAHLLVLATGVNSHHPLTASFGYRPPKTEVMAQDEILLPDGYPDGEVQAFFRHPHGLKFGALIPKGHYLNISLLGEGLSTEAVEEFLEQQGLNQQWGQPASLCGCTPRVAVSPARRYFGDHWVAVGDAAVTRLYKDGIGAAFRTAEAAMQTAVRYGIHAGAFHHHYAPLCRQIAWDNVYGRLIFRLWELTMCTPWLLDAWKRCLHREASLPPRQRVHLRILWGMFTGDEPYRTLFALSLQPRAWWGMWRH